MSKKIAPSVVILLGFVFLTESLLMLPQNRKEGTGVDFQLSLVSRYLSLGMIDEARNILDKAMASFPENHDIRLYRGIALCMEKNYESAYKDFKTIENSLDLNKRGGRRPLGDRLETVSLQMERFVFSSKNKNLLDFGRGVTLIAWKEDYKTAVSKLTSAIKNGYDTIHARYLLVYAYLKLRDYKKADQALTEFLKRKEIDEKDYFLKGYLSYQVGLKKEAELFFQKAAEINPGFREAKKNLACIHYNEGEYERAAEIWESLDEDIESRLNLARAYFRSGRKEEARKQLELLNLSVSLEKYSPSRIPLNLIGPEEWFKFHFDETITFEELIKIQVDPERLRRMGIKPSMLFAQLNEEALFSLRATGKSDKAIEILTLASQMEDAPFYLYYNLGALHFNSGNLEKAKENAWISIERKGDFLDAHDLLGNIYFVEKNIKMRRKNSGAL